MSRDWPPRLARRATRPARASEPLAGSTPSTDGACETRMWPAMPTKKPVVTGMDKRSAMKPSLQRAGANEDHPDHDAERRRGRGIVGRPRRREHRQRAGENRRDGRIRATESRRLSPNSANPIAPAISANRPIWGVKFGEASGRHLRGNGDRGQRQAGDCVGAEVARTPAGERTQDEPGAFGDCARRKSLCLTASPHFPRLHAPKR